MKIMNLNTKTLPKIAWQSLAVILVMLIEGTNKGIFYERITTLIMMFGAGLLLLKIASSILFWCSESIADILIPIKIFIGAAAIHLTIQYFCPSYTIKPNIEPIEMAIGCNNAEWDISVYYTLNGESKTEEYKMNLKGSSEYITNNVERIAKEMIAYARPNATYEYYTYNLWYMPKDWVLKHRYEHNWYEAKELRHNDLLDQYNIKHN